MANSTRKKLDRLHKLTIAFKKVSDTVDELLNNDIRISDDHFNSVSEALKNQGRSDTEATKRSRDMLFCLMQNKGRYHKQYRTP